MNKITGTWRINPDTQNLFNAVLNAGFECYFVGGCVRNALLNQQVRDIDIATNALPQNIIDIAENNGLRAIPTGIDHGTVTVLAGNVAHEITTYRKDIITDGRHAKVAFSQNITDDAKRRDFTMNAIYCDKDGHIIDPLAAIPDLKAHRVKFILDPAQRIKEDYLRILRFFRFYAWYGDTDNGIDPEGLAACAVNLDGLSALSKERVGAEMLKLLSATNPSASVAAMQKAGVLQKILTGADSKPLPILVHYENETNTHPNPIRRLVSLGMFDWSDELRLSRKQSTQITKLRNGVNTNHSFSALGFLYGEQVAMDIVLLKSALLETPFPKDAPAQIQSGTKKTFPVNSINLMPEYTGKQLGQALKRLQEHWLSTDMALTKSELLKTLAKNGD